MKTAGSHLFLGLLLIVNFLWAAQYPAYKIASERMPPAALSVCVLLFAVVLLAPFLWRERRRTGVSGRSHLSPRAALQFVVLGIFGIVPPSVVMAWGISRSTASNASILSLTIPVLMTLFGIVLLAERLTFLRTASLLIALAGTAVISWSDFSTQLFAGSVLIGNTAILLAGAGSAFYNTYSKVLLVRFTELEVLVYSNVVGLLCCLAIVIATGEFSSLRFEVYPYSVWAAIGVLGGLSWGLAMLLWMWVLKRLEAGQVSVSIYLLSAFGVLLSAITLGERPGIGQLLGGLLVLGATYLVSDYENRERAAHRADDDKP